MQQYITCIIYSLSSGQTEEYHPQFSYEARVTNITFSMAIHTAVMYTVTSETGNSAFNLCCVCDEDSDTTLLLTLKFALASVLWKQVWWNLNTVCRKVLVCGRILFAVIWPKCHKITALQSEITLKVPLGSWYINNCIVCLSRSC